MSYLEIIDGYPNSSDMKLSEFMRRIFDKACEIGSFCDKNFEDRRRMVSKAIEGAKNPLTDIECLAIFCSVCITAVCQEKDLVEIVDKFLQKEADGVRNA